MYNLNFFAGKALFRRNLYSNFQLLELLALKSLFKNKSLFKLCTVWSPENGAPKNVLRNKPSG